MDWVPHHRRAPPQATLCLGALEGLWERATTTFLWLSYCGCLGPSTQRTRHLQAPELRSNSYGTHHPPRLHECKRGLWWNLREQVAFQDTVPPLCHNSLSSGLTVSCDISRLMSHSLHHPIVYGQSGPRFLESGHGCPHGPHYNSCSGRGHVSEGQRVNT